MPDSLDPKIIEDSELTNILPGAVLHQDVKKYREVCDQFTEDLAELERYVTQVLQLRIARLKSTSVDKILKTGDAETEFKRILEEISKIEEEQKDCQKGSVHQKYVRRYEALNDVYETLRKRIRDYESHLGTNKTLAMMLEDE